MSNKTIYICDRCHSFTEQKDVFSITFGGFVDIKAQTYHPEITANGKGASFKRELCNTCIKELIQEFGLDKSTTDLRDELFTPSKECDEIGELEY